MNLKAGERLSRFMCPSYFCAVMSCMKRASCMLVKNLLGS